MKRKKKKEEVEEETEWLVDDDDGDGLLELEVDAAWRELLPIMRTWMRYSIR